MLNENDFTLYAGKSADAGKIKAENTGKVDFKNTIIDLGCMNCNEGDFAASTDMSADEAIADERILFVNSMIIHPEEPAVKDKTIRRSLTKE
jgi:hypothetical protein